MNKPIRLSLVFQGLSEPKFKYIQNNTSKHIHLSGKHLHQQYNLFIAFQFILFYISHIGATTRTYIFIGK